MKAVIFAGGLGTRLSEETHLKPKPMVEIGGKPILWHIMKLYSHYGINDFIICCGYKSYIIKDFFKNYQLHNSSVTFDFVRKTTTYHDNVHEPWRVTLVDTGEYTSTASRLAAVKQYLQDDSNFCLTYGDGLINLNIRNLINFHEKHGKIATITVSKAPARFGAISHQDGLVQNFEEKPEKNSSFVNSGFFVLKSNVFNYIPTYDAMWEREPLENLTSDKQLMAYENNNFWQPMDTLRDKNLLEELWEAGHPPWKVW